VVAAGKLFERGILMKDGAALERAAEVSSVAFDKTGTLTFGQPRVVRSSATDAEASDVAYALAAVSSHPLSRALATHLDRGVSFTGKIEEIPGRGVEGLAEGITWRLGSRDWCGLPEGEDSGLTEVWLTANGTVRAWYHLSDLARPSARAGVAELEHMGLSTRLISGDRQGPVDAIARAVGIEAATSGLRPEEKVAAVSDGHTMMVGDGINDAPALRAAHVSMAPTSAADIGRSAADFVFSGEDLGAVSFVILTARRASRLVSQNLVLAIGYNAVAVPLAICGLVTPLVAAIAMSSSSIIVVANALRLRFDGRMRTARPAAGGTLIPRKAVS
jgi:Cu2+-exporting ATPase